MLFDLFRRFAGDRRGNVAMYFGLAAVPLTIGMGMVLDYGNNTRKWVQMNSAADAAALAGVTPAMMLQSDAAAQTAATNIFNAQINGVISNDTVTNLSITSSTTGLQRTVTVNYTAQLKNIFGGIIGQPTMTVQGTKVATGTPANMNFYLLLDTSPSMEIAGTTTGITTMLNNTKHQGGCAFACHESNPPPCPYSVNGVPVGAVNSLSSSSTYTGKTDINTCSDATTLSAALGSSGTPYYTVSGGTYNKNTNPYTGIDNYQLARNLGITLRIDMVATAAQAMVQAAIQQQTNDKASYGSAPTYNIGIYTFDTALHSLYPITNGSGTPLSTLQTNLAASPSPVQALEVPYENTICQTWSGSSCTSVQSNSDMDTNIDAALNALNNPSAPSTYIPNPSTANTSEVLLIVTDGVEDELVSSSTAGKTLSVSGGYRQQAPFAANSNVPSYQTCAAIKARGIKIGILYTAYVPLDNGSAGSWYDTYLYPFQPGAPSLTGDQIGPDLMNCASSSDLFMTVPPSDDTNAIANALVQLFLRAQSPHLTQ
jgi:Flp pilus assembly protein TadG